MTPPSISDVTLATSNQQKINEYRRFTAGTLNVMSGADLDEVDGTPDEIIVHKALAAGPGRMVEDAILVVDGKPMTDIRWRLDELLNGSVAPGTSAVWEVRLGVLHEGIVYAYLGQTVGSIAPYDVQGFGVDPILHVTEANATMARLDAEGVKDQWSARRYAIMDLVAQKPYLSIAAADVAPWNGPMQNAD